MLRAVLNKSWRQHPSKQQLYGHLLPITKTIQVRRTRHAGHCWRSKDKLISDVLLWTPTYRRANVERTARTYVQQLCADTECSRERWTIGMDGERGSGKSVQAARHDDAFTKPLHLVKDVTQDQVWFVGFYGISTFVGYLTPNSFYVNNLFYLNQFSLA